MAVPPVWSSRLFGASIVSTPDWHALYTVPSAKVLILRRVTVVNLTGATHNAILGLNHDIQQVLMNAVPNSSSLDLDLWLVYDAGDEVSFYGDAGTWQVTAHGQVLSAP